MKGATGISGGAAKLAVGIRAVGAVAQTDAAVAVVVKVGRGALRLSELLVMAVAGSAITAINRYLASRQALKIIPLRNCGKEWTAGINGHLGACVCDPLGPADRIIEFILGTGDGSAINWAFGGRSAIAQLADHFGINPLDAISGLTDPHYGSDSGTYKQLVQRYGLAADPDATPAQQAANNHVYLQRLAGINDVGSNPGDLPSSAPGLPLGTESGVLSSSPNTSYEFRTGTTATAYAQTVRSLSSLVPTSGKASATAATPTEATGNSRVASRLSAALTSAGVTALPVNVSKADDFLQQLGGASSSYSSQWDDVTGSGQLASVPNGALVVWTAKQIGNSAGQIGIVVHQGGAKLFGENGRVRLIPVFTVAIVVRKLRKCHRFRRNRAEKDQKRRNQGCILHCRSG